MFLMMVHLGVFGSWCTAVAVCLYPGRPPYLGVPDPSWGRYPLYIYTRARDRVYSRFFCALDTFFESPKTAPHLTCSAIPPNGQIDQLGKIPSFPEKRVAHSIGIHFPKVFWNGVFFPHFLKSMKWIPGSILSDILKNGCIPKKWVHEIWDFWNVPFLVIPKIH